MSTYKLTTNTNRVTFQQDNGATDTPALNEVRTSSIGNTLFIYTPESTYTVNLLSDTLIINGTTYAAGSKTGTQAEVLVNALFPSANGGNGGTAVDLTPYETSSHASSTYATQSSVATKTTNLTPTAVKTSAYTAAANELVKTDASSGNVPVTLPTAPADKSRICIKMIAVSGSFTTTFTTGGSDVLNKAGGSTSGTLYLLNQAVTLQYEAATGIWSVISSDVPLSQLDLRLAPIAIASSADIDKVAHINAYGDSLTEGTASQTPYTAYLMDKVGIPVRNAGVATESATSIRTRLVADTTRLSWPTIIWAGTNGYQTNTSTPLAEIATMVAALGHTNYLVLSILGLSTDTVGGTNYNNRVALNSSLSSTYGSRFVDIRSDLMTRGTGTGQDATDVTNDVIPTSLRVDATHLNSAGYSYVADKIYLSITTLLATTGIRLTTNNIAALPSAFLRDKIVFTQATGVSHTGTTSNTSLAISGTIPGASIGKNGRLEVLLILSAAANNANNKQVFITLNGFNAIIANINSGLSSRYLAIICNRNSYISQIAGNSGGGSGLGFNSSSSSAVSTYNINTMKDITVAVSATLAVGTDTITIEFLQIRAIN